MKTEIIISLNPGKNYEVIGQVPFSTTAEIDAKIAKAHQAQQGWAALDVQNRITVLEYLYNEFVKRKNEIGLLVTKEIGMPVSVRDAIDIDVGLRYMRGYLDYAPQWLAPEVVFQNAAEIHTLFFEPRGVMGVSIPWNFPFCNFVWGVIQNLVVGNAVVFKHSEQCALTGKLLEEIIMSSSLPEGICSQVYGDRNVGDYLMSLTLDGIYFTGSTAVGKHLYQVAAQKFIPALLELGGSAPAIVCDDADVSLTVESIYCNRFVNSGQTCDGLKRLIVHERLFDEVVTKLKKLLATKKVGDPEDPTTDIGPLVCQRQLTVLEEQVADALQKGATVVAGAKRPDACLGAYYEPTIFTSITFDMRVWKEEVFGLVLPIVSFQSDDEAIALANDTPYGLGAYVYTADHERALHISKCIQTGNVSINGANYYGRAEDPFGGYKYSGLGREHGKQGLRELSRSKLIALKK